MFRKLLASLRRKKKPREITLISSTAHCVGDYYKYKIKDCKDIEEATLKLLAHFYYGYPRHMVEAESCTITYPGLSRTITNLPMAVHLGISGERMTDAQWKEYEEWKLRAKKYAEEHSEFSKTSDHGKVSQ